MEAAQNHVGFTLEDQPLWNIKNVQTMRTDTQIQIDALCFRRSKSNRFSFQWGQLFIFTSHFSFEQFASCFGFGLGGGGGGARRPCITVQLPAVSTPIGQNSGQCASNQTIAAWLTTPFWQHHGWRSSIQLSLSWWTAKKKEKNMFIASWRELWNAFPPWKLAKR